MTTGAVAELVLVAVTTALAVWLVRAVVRWWRLREAVKQLAGGKMQFPYGTMKEHTSNGSMDYAIKYCDVDPIKPIRYCVSSFMTIVALRRPQDIKNVVLRDEPKSKMAQNLLGDWLGLKSILLLNGPKWKSMRHMLNPAFSRAVIEDYIPTMVESAEELAAKFEQHARTPEEAVDVTQDFSLFTLDTVCRCAFSFKSDVQHSRNDQFTQDFFEMGPETVQRFRNPLHLLGPIYNLTSAAQRHRQRIHRLHTHAAQIIEQRRKELDGMSIEDVTTHKRPSGRALFDFLDICLLSRDKDGNPALTDEEIRSQCDTFLFAGHDTTATALTWLTFCLAKHPECQERCREEIFDLLGPDAAPTFTNLAKLPYTTACIKEAMRLYSPVIAVHRQLKSPLMLECGVQLPAGTTVAFSIFMLHRNPTVWEDPLQYNPDRFLDMTVDAFAFMPFSTGRRNCIGNNFAMHEIRVAMCQLLRRFKFVDAEHEPALQSALVLRSANGVKVKIQPLDS
ncbi:hypothetical protein PTSG_09918 [Salpingoeca rosetta]|uniref:Cytochrome P450 n=1 Tax=Salpingoeca rosetta (strain ATCC 50818 / BSB-021) TaxID=946362 RepID=F2UNI4_SALR5|nr:uncharacterized protein PTSG_09918 [Salpingoeca rosetta]EGD79189.1 hypothetical protein PTSG_09918 [Salpingoeca rosetta]|eukprot:XP_004989274.1 hypothetical protein PTSG_09918 [Salpingoeca rosetta]